MGDVINMRPAGSALETLYQAAEECAERPELLAIVVLYNPDDAREVYGQYAADVDPVTAYYVLSPRPGRSKWGAVMKIKALIVALLLDGCATEPKGPCLDGYHLPVEHGFIKEHEGSRTIFRKVSYARWVCTEWGEPYVPAIPLD